MRGNRLGDNEVHLTYRMTKDMNQAAIQDATDQLSLEERSRHDRFVFAHDRRDFAVAHALLRQCLSAYGDRRPRDWALTAGAHGKPSLSAEDFARTHLTFNLAHTREMVACAISRDLDIGVDVETIDRENDPLELASRFFSQPETETVRRCQVAERQRRFIEIWTLKEAFVKAIGEGLSCPLREFSFTFGDPPSLLFDTSIRTPHAMWSFALFAPSDRHRMAVAIGVSSLRRPVVRVFEHAAADGHRMTPIASLRVALG